MHVLIVCLVYSMIICQTMVQICIKKPPVTQFSFMFCNTDEKLIPYVCLPNIVTS